MIWLVRLKESAWMRQLLWATLGANIVLDLVVFETNPLPAAIRISHTLLGQLFFSTTVVIASFTSKSWNQIQKPVKNASRLRPRETTTAALVLLQVAPGAAFRHGADGSTAAYSRRIGACGFSRPAMAVILRTLHPA